MKLIRVKKADLNESERLQKVFKQYTNAGMELGAIFYTLEKDKQKLSRKDVETIQTLIVQLSNVSKQCKQVLDRLA